ncbi:MAG: hypothetical protein WAW85_13835, partial [Gordonia sp. (in: high G+C Gram-positive bacteria)]|uniref:hypothetical protein n=1 Tax=Gordonia sp. (in: high G+C Gram-positive bacteria) TaxID=84139 RepID=UPI003BB7A007
CTSNQDVVDGSDLVFLALRTEQCADAVAELRFRDDHVVVNVMAAISAAHLRDMLHTRPHIVRAMPLQEVSQRNCLTVLFPTHPDVEALFERLGGALAVDNETAFIAFCGLASTVSTHYEYLASLANWAGAQGIRPADAERFLRSLFAGVGRSLTDDNLALDPLRTAHETPGGANERVRHRWFSPAEPALHTVLDDLLADLRDQA